MSKKINKSLIFMLVATLTLSMLSMSAIKVSAVTPFIPTPTDPQYEGATWGFDNNTIMGWNMELFMGMYGLPLTKFIEIPLIYNASLAYGYDPDFSMYFYAGLLQSAYFDPSSNSIKTNNSIAPIPCSLTNFTNNMFMSIDPTSLSGPFDALLAPPFIPYNATSLGNEYDLLLPFCANALVYDPLLSSFIIGPGGTPTYGYAPDNSWIRVENMSTGFYVEYRYYNNGTLKSAILSGEMSMDDGMGGVITIALLYNITRTFDFNPIDDVEWGVDIGDTLYYGMLGNETKFEVIGIRNETLSLNLGLTSAQQVVQLVDANMSVWDESLGWVLALDNITIGIANEYNSLLFYLFSSMSMGSPSMNPSIAPLLVPVGTTGEELAGIFSMIGPMSMSGSMSDLLIDIELLDHGFKYSLTNSSNPTQRIDFYLDYFPNGVLKVTAMDMLMGSDALHFVIYSKNHTIYAIGDYSFQFSPITQIPISINVDISLDEAAEVLFSALEFNPFNQSDPNQNLPNGLLYIDLMILNSTALNQGGGGAINITIQLDKSYENLKVWYFNTNTGTWEEVSYVDLGGNKIMITLDHASIYGLSGSVSQNQEEEKIPFGSSFVIFMVIGILTLLAYTYKKRKFKT